MSLRARAIGGLALGVGLLVARGARADDAGVVVHDEKLERASRRDPSAASTVIRREELERPGADAASVLSRVPGVQVARSGSSSDMSTASLRGATSAQTPVYLAGIRLNDDVTGTADLSRIPLWMLDRVEVFRGSAPEDVDRLGIGGAVIFEPRLPRHDSIGAGAGVGSFGERSAWLGGTVAADEASALVAVRREHFDNDYRYLDDSGTAFDTSDDRVIPRPNADSDSFDAWAVGRSQLLGRLRVTSVVNAFSREQGVTGVGTTPALSARTRISRELAGLRATVPCQRAREGEPADGCQLELVTSALVGSQIIRDPRGELAIGTPELTSRGARATTGAHVVLRPTDAWRLRLGGSRESELLGIDRVGAPGLRARRDLERADASVSVAPGERVELRALGALECHGTHGPGSAGSGCELEPSARLGAVYHVAERVSVLANLGRYVRVPTLGELYGVSAVVLGNSALAPETGLSVDSGVRASAGTARSFGLALDAFAFARSARDLVAYRRSSLGAVRPYNVARARVLGVELGLVAVALDHVRLDASATLLDPRDVTPDRQVTNDLVPYQSRLVSNARLELYHEPHALADRVAAGASTSYRASRVADPAGLIVLGEQWLVGLDLSALFWQRRLALRAALDNLLDARQFDAVGFPLPGRSYHLAAELWWW